MLKKYLSSLFIVLSAFSQVMAADSPVDYSHVGYKQSAEAIPDVPVKVYVAWEAGDQSSRIQQAIDKVAALKPSKKNGLRGAVLLGKGTFELSEPLRISASGVVLRGSGRSETVLLKKGCDRGAVVYLEGKQGIERGDTVDAAAVRQGDNVIVWQQSTKEWIEKMGCTNFGGGKDLGYWGWHPGEIDVLSTRKVMGVKGGQPVFDVPLTSTMGGMKFIRIKADRRMSSSGVENLTIDSEYDTGNPLDENHAWDGVNVINAIDCWVRMVNFRHLAGSAVVTQRTASQITVEDCISVEPVSEIGGYRRRTFLCMGERNLFQRLYSEHGIHDFSAFLCAAGPNVFSQCDSYESLGYSGSLGPWCTGLLFDCVNIDGNDLKLNNIGLENYGSGWTTTNSTAYQCTASGIFADSLPDGSKNYVYGCWAQFNGKGEFAESNNHVKPWSLFANQLEKRVGNAELVKRICRTMERSTNSISNNPTYEEAQTMVELARKPRLTMKMWIDSAALSPSLVTPVRTTVSAKADDRHEAERPEYAVVNGKLVVNGRLLVGKRHNAPWWNGRVRYSAFPKMADGVTRFVPEMESQGTTTRIDSVADHMNRAGVALFRQNYGLWYDRRRDDHERIRRRNGDVWAPFYEQSIARSGKGTAWDGLSKYDVTKLNSWYVSRICQLAEATAGNGMVVLNEHYFQHNILEAGAHWVDCPWRAANNINGTVTPEPVPFAGDKRVYMAEYFYNIDNPTMARLHRTYIENMLGAFADEPNVINSIGEEYTGPYHFTKFWLRTVGEWEKAHGRKVLVALSANKNVQDSVMQDAEAAEAVDIINIEQWWYTHKGLYAPEGGRNLAPRQYLRRIRPGKVLFEDVYRSVSETRKAYPTKAVLYYASAYDRQGWAVLMAGGSCPEIPVTDDAFLKDVATMDKTSSEEGAYFLTNDAGEQVVYVSEGSSAEVRQLPVKAIVSKVDGKTGAIGKAEKVNTAKGFVTLSTPGIYWIRTEKK